LTIHADPKINTPAPDFMIKERRGRIRGVSYPKMVSENDSKIRLGLLKLTNGV
jgi:hypothetical protein